MTPEHVTDLLGSALLLSAILVGPLLLTGLTVGLAVGVIQAATQVQETTLSLLPKLAAMGVALVLAAPWAIDKLTRFTSDIIMALPEWAGRGGPMP